MYVFIVAIAWYSYFSNCLCTPSLPHQASIDDSSLASQLPTDTNEAAFRQASSADSFLPLPSPDSALAQVSPYGSSSLSEAPLWQSPEHMEIDEEHPRLAAPELVGDESTDKSTTTQVCVFEGFVHAYSIKFCSL